MGSKEKVWQNVVFAIAAILVVHPLSSQTSRQSLDCITPTHEVKADAHVWLPTAGGAIREIDDSANGDRWLLFHDENQPGGPGRLIRVENLDRGCAAVTLGRARSGIVYSALRSSKIVIHSGDTLLVEQHTAVVDAVLDATALEPGIPGGTLKVRLKVNDKVVLAVAKEEGRAGLAPAEAQP